MTPEILNAVAAVLSAVAWPLVVVTFLFTQREKIGFLLENLESFTLPGGGGAKLRSRVDKEARATVRSTKADEGVPDERQIRAAKRIEKIALDTDVETVRRQVLSLANEYDRIRASMPYSAARTRRMELIVTKMRTLGLSMEPFLPELMNSSSPGERLAAVAALQIRPREDYLEWLATRVSDEKPFIGYHAAGALRVAVRMLEPSSLEALRRAIEVAKQAVEDLPADADRSRAISAAQRELDELSQSEIN